MKTFCNLPKRRCEIRNNLKTTLPFQICQIQQQVTISCLKSILKKSRKLENLWFFFRNFNAYIYTQQFRYLDSYREISMPCGLSPLHDCMSACWKVERQGGRQRTQCKDLKVTEREYTMHYGTTDNCNHQQSNRKLFCVQLNSVVTLLGIKCALRRRKNRTIIKYKHGTYWKKTKYNF